MKKIILATLGTGLLVAGFNASAATDTTTISPSLTINTACTVDAGAVSGTFPAVAFGGTSTPAMDGGNLVVDCPTVAYKVGANQGSNSSGTTRNLSDGTSSLAYILSIGGTLWGDADLTGVSTVLTDNALSVASGTAADSHAITGVLSAALAGTEAAGIYNDTVTITLEW